MSDRYPVRDPPRIYLRTQQRKGGNEVVFSLAIKNTADFLSTVLLLQSQIRF